MSLPQEDGVGSLCQKALRIVTELCFAGRVERETCAGIFPAERGGQGGGSTGERAPRPGPGRPPASRRRPQLREAGCRAPGPPSRGGRRAGAAGARTRGTAWAPERRKCPGGGRALPPVERPTVPSPEDGWVSRVMTPSAKPQGLSIPLVR